MRVRRRLRVILLVGAGAGCAHSIPAASPNPPQRAQVGCYIVDARFDSAGERRLGDSGQLSGVHPDTLGFGGGPAHWQDTVALVAARSPRDRADSLGPFYQVRPTRQDVWHVWQRRGDAIWVYHGTGVIGSTDVLRVDDGELRGTRTYGTDTGAAYFATVWYHPAHCLGF